MAQFGKKLAESKTWHKHNMETLQRTANRGSISTGYDIDNSLKLERGLSERLTRTPSSDGNERTFTFSAWVKFTYINTGVSDWSALFSAGDQASGTPSFRIGHHTNNHLQVSFYKNGAYQGYYRTDALYRDTNAWYHYVIAVDTTQATNTNRVKIYVNGEQAPTTATVSHISQNYDSGVNRNGVINQIGAFTNSSVFSYASEYVAETHFVDGQALAPTEFGEFDDDSGIWKPKKYTGSYGTNGFYLDYADAGDLGDDESGNGNDFTENNITSADQATDTPTNNFATFNALHPLAASTNIRQGSTQFYINSNYQTAVASIAVSKGKWYAEFSPDSNATFVGFVDVEDAYIPQNHTGYYLGYAGGNQNRSVSMKGNNGAVYNYTGTATGATFGSGDIVSLALDMDNRKVYWAVNGTWVNSANPSNGTNGITWNTSSTLGDAWTDVITMGVTGYSNIHWKCNFGGFTIISISSGNADANGYGNFEYTVPTGFYALCTKNLAEEG